MPRITFSIGRACMLDLRQWHYKRPVFGANSMHAFVAVAKCPQFGCGAVALACHGDTINQWKTSLSVLVEISVYIYLCVFVRRWGEEGGQRWGNVL